MFNFFKIGLFVIVAFLLCIGGYFLLEKEEWEWQKAKKQVNQFAEFAFEGTSNEKPDKIEFMNLQTKFIENDVDDDFKIGFILTASIAAQESKTIKRNFSEFLVKRRSLDIQTIKF